MSGGILKAICSSRGVPASLSPVSLSTWSGLGLGSGSGYGYGLELGLGLGLGTGLGSGLGLGLARELEHLVAVGVPQGKLHEVAELGRRLAAAVEERVDAVHVEHRRERLGLG